MTTSTAIHPFRIDIPQADLDDLFDRVRRARWPQHPSGDDWARGVPQTYLRELAQYWTDGFDWRTQEAELNQFPQFTTIIDGQTIHFFHVRSQVPGARPMLLTHGWPSSPVEFRNLIGPLTDPAAHGGDPGQAFHLVLPSLPGYGFSAPVSGPGWGNLFTVAQAWSELMNRLGYPRYAVHGTDAGGGVASLLGMVAPEAVIGIHLTGTGPAFPFGPPLETDGLDGADLARAERYNARREDGFGYLHLQATRPQTLSYALTDSPLGQLAWIVEKFAEWTDPAKPLPHQAVELDHLLASVTITWLTGAGGSSAHAVYEGMLAYRELVGSAEGGGESWGASGDDAEGAGGWPAGPPTGYSVFAADDTIASVVDPAGTAHWVNHDRGGHFPSMEVPELMVADLRNFFGPLR